MKVRHKRIIKRSVAGIFALLLAYAASFGSWFVFPFAIGFASVQFLSWKMEKTTSTDFSGGSLAVGYSVIAIVILCAITLWLSTAIATMLVFVFGIGGVIFSYMLSKTETNIKKKKKKIR